VYQGSRKLHATINFSSVIVQEQGHACGINELGYDTFSIGQIFLYNFTRQFLYQKYKNSGALELRLKGHLQMLFKI